MTSSEAGATSARSVLLCDDEFHILRAAEFKLRRAGFEVSCASDGLEALQKIEQQLPDALITDCQMPRMNGIQLIQQLRARPETSQLPIIMLTAKGYELPVEELKSQFGVADIIAKPFSPRELLKRVEQLIEQSGKVVLAPES